MASAPRKIADCLALSTGAPCSHQRTWAENGFFECFHSTCQDPPLRQMAVTAEGPAPADYGMPRFILQSRLIAHERS